MVNNKTLLKYKKFIDQHVNINAVEWALFKSKLKLDYYKKGEIIHTAGSVCNRLMFINHGIVRAYVIDPNGKDYTWSICFNDKNSKMTNVYVVDYDSFINKTSSQISFEVLQDCELLSVSYDDTQFLYNYSKKGERFGRLMAELAYSHVHRLFIDRSIKTAKERFEDFVEQTPYLLDKVPQYHIATYLGIAPQSLSRLKKEMASPM